MPTATDYSRYSRSSTTPARKAVAITPSDAVELTSVTRGIYVGVAGNVAVTLVDDSAAVTFVGVAAGTILPVAAKLVMATNTTATTMLALYGE